MRIDQLLVERGLAASRSQAQRLIAAGDVECSDGRYFLKNRRFVPLAALIFGVKAFLLRSAESCQFRRLRQGFPDDPVRKVMFPPRVPHGDQCHWRRAHRHRRRMLGLQEEEGRADPGLGIGIGSGIR